MVIKFCIYGFNTRFIFQYKQGKPSRQRKSAKYSTFSTPYFKSTKFSSIYDSISARTMIRTFDRHHWFSMFGDVLEHTEISSYLLSE